MINNINDSTDLNSMFPRVNKNIIINGNNAMMDYINGTYVVDWMKSVKDNISDNVDDEKLDIYKELLGHTTQDIDEL